MKIGASSVPLRRWREILASGQNPEPLKRIAVYHAGTTQSAFNLEKALHKIFHRRRVFGEWFTFDFHNPDDKKDFKVGCSLYLTSGWWQTFRPDDLERLEKAA